MMFREIGSQLTSASIDVGAVIETIKNLFGGDVEQVVNGRTTVKTYSLKSTSQVKGQLGALTGRQVVAVKLIEAETLARKCAQLGHTLAVSPTLLEQASSLFPYSKK